MTPRRSSRARTTQPPPSVLQHTNSSSSSSSHSRGERNTRSNHKAQSPHRSSTQRSQSIDDAEANWKNDFPQTRQRQRTREDEDHDNRQRTTQDEEYEEGEEEDEITRCICRQQDYPGLPPSRREALERGRMASGLKDESVLGLPTDLSDLMPDELGSMFIQCDTCKVWQHGGCVGIMDEAMSPDEYFCEECRKDLHKIRAESNGQYSSQYLPVAPVSSPAPSSRESTRDSSRRPKDSKSRQNGIPTVTKRRSTNNSREAAYDEEEQLRRAIEESKEDTQATAEEASSRRSKRSRSDSETNKQVAKRQRTGSASPPAASKQANSISQPASEDEAKTRGAANGVKKQRLPSRNQREKDSKDTEEVEQERPESSGNRRKARSDRRRGEAESDHDVGSPVKAVVNELAAEPAQPSPDPSVPVQEPTNSRSSTRKSGRPPTRQGGRGRNQYTRDRDLNLNGTDSNNSPRRGYSHDIGADSPRVGAHGTNGHVNGGEFGRPSRPRYMNPQRTTMNEMKRRVAAILEFISRMQVEMATAGESSSTPISNGDKPNGSLPKAVADHLENGAPSIANDVKESTPATDGVTEQVSKEKDFKDLSSIEMMDVLTRHLLKWQQEYGKFGER
ncbi:hypothetical protein MAP00_004791 [Monascus purpureus]|nr:hypothetical protein MAP00_004791 [Monascus purpureus]